MLNVLSLGSAKWARATGSLALSGFIKIQSPAARSLNAMTTPDLNQTPDLLQTYSDADAALRTVINSVPSDGWDNQSPCADWKARDVVTHLIDTQRDFLGKHAELGVAPEVDTDPAAAWDQHSAAVQQALADSSLVNKEIDGYFGPTTVGATLQRFYVFDLYVHRWDLARSAGAHSILSDAELDAIEASADSFGDAIRMEGICGPEVEVSADADRQTKLLARLGRTA